MGRRGVMGEEEGEVGEPLGFGCGNGDVGLPVVEADAGEGGELPHGCGEPFTAVEVFDFLLFLCGLPALRLCQQLGCWWLVGDEEPDLPGVAADEVQPEQRAYAGAEHECWLTGHGAKKLRRVLAVGGEINLRRRVVDGAAGETTPVVGEDRVAAGQGG